jgi:hypothetical protein
VPTDKELFTLREEIYTWTKDFICDKITPTKKPETCHEAGGGSEVGDSILFSSLLFYSGERWARENIHQAKDSQGGMWRSAQRCRDRVGGSWGFDRFSQDHMLGVLLYLVTEYNRGNKSTARSFANHWGSWMANHLSQGEFSLCRWDYFDPDAMDACALEGTVLGVREAIIRHVFDYIGANAPRRRKKILGIIPSWEWHRLGDGGSPHNFLTYLSLGCALAPTRGKKFICHLLSVASLIFQEMGDDQRISLDEGFSVNPFALWVNNGRKANDEIRQLTYDRCLEAHNSHKNDKNSHNQWMWERSSFESEVSSNSFGWDCIMMLNLLLGDPINLSPTIPIQIDGTFPDGTLMRDNAEKIYRIEAGLKRYFTNRDVFDANGFDWSAVRDVPDSIINSTPDGTPYTTYESKNKTFVDGTLLENRGNYYLILESKRCFLSTTPTMWAFNINKNNARHLDDLLFDSLPPGSLLSVVDAYSDQTLLCIDDAVFYLIENKQKRRFQSIDVIEANGFSIQFAIYVVEELTKEIPDGLEYLAHEQQNGTYPDGIVLLSSDDRKYLMEGSLKHLVTNDLVLEVKKISLDSYRRLPKSIIDSIPDGSPIGIESVLPDGTLLADANSGTLYLMEGGQKRRILDPGNFDRSGKSVVDVSPAELSLIPDGVDIDNKAPTPSPPSFPDGTLLADANSGTLYLMEGGQKRRILDPGNFNLSGKSVIDVSLGELSLIPDGVNIDNKAPTPSPTPSPPSFPDGTLLADANSGTLYLMEGGQKRRILDPGSYNFNGKEILDITFDKLSLIPNGDDI